MSDYSSNMIELYRKMHENPKIFEGLQTLHFKDQIKKLCEIYNAKSLLDYGCGKGKQYHKHKLHEYWNINKLGLYDIGVEQYSNKPEDIYDIVICIDVLEHVDENYIDDIIKELDNYARYAVLVNIATIEARKTLPDGRNAHTIVKDKNWWKEKIVSLTTKTWIMFFRTELTKKTGKFEKIILNREQDPIKYEKINDIK